MVAMTRYYGRMKGEFHSPSSEETAELTQDWLVTAATGAAVGLASATLGGMDKKIGGFNVPIDGLMSVALGVGGLVTRNHKYAQIMKVASIAAGGSAAVRTFEKFFRSNIHLGVKGEFEDLGRHGIGELGVSGHGRRHALHSGYGYGASAQDRLVEAARYL
jgi:hypothetical protein